MQLEQIKLLNKELGIELSEEKVDIFCKYEQIFLEKNSHTNLISKNDVKLLFEKHIFDSLAIHKFFKNFPARGAKTLLDIGTGGGFPSVPIAISYEEINVFAIDSIRKKINILEDFKAILGLKNLFPICDRVENLKSDDELIKYDYITTRAVAPVEVILKYAVPHLKQDGYFIAYKSKKAVDELQDAKKTMKKYGLKIVDVIEYILPLEEVYKRNLIIFKQ